jgi:hypothetical protein
MRSMIILVAGACAATCLLAQADEPSPSAPASSLVKTQSAPSPAPKPASDASALRSPLTPDSEAAHLAWLEKQLKAKGYAPQMRAGQLVYCKREVPLGSRLASVYRCLTPDGAERVASGTREDLEEMQRETGHCLLGSRPNSSACG